MAAFFRSEAIEEGADSAPRRLDGAFSRLAESGFELGEALFNRVKIGRIGGQEAQRGARPLDGCPPGGPLVAAEIVQDDDIAGSQSGEEALFHIGEEAGAIDRAIADTGGGQAVAPEGSPEGQGLPMTIGPRGGQPRAAGAAAVAARHSGLGPRLIKNTSRWGSSWPWERCQRARRRALSGRSCSEAERLFFEADPGPFEEPGQPPGIGLHPSLYQQPGR